ncbi:hypothetical protein [Gilvimarinus xylanilyticus]|uniref:Uncharacterized protein n=1 Tax=Gilvimarinus xylanilyticus TaxID=2944139 RepID=A0A9X2I3Q1_9GAMM|nr:hypothetical protein [Gilvimarinus xylanilyticus]MCP8898882.1 hypothetical protein [Gilvimarinus xylanilyticus]
MERHVLWLLLALALGAQAENNYQYVCQLDGEQRLIEVAYLLPDQAVPCEVRYRKNDEELQVLWRADNQEGYCESKANQLMKEQREWGFECAAQNKPAGPVSSTAY